MKKTVILCLLVVVYLIVTGYDLYAIGLGMYSVFTNVYVGYSREINGKANQVLIFTLLALFVSLVIFFVSDGGVSYKFAIPLLLSTIGFVIGVGILGLFVLCVLCFEQPHFDYYAILIIIGVAVYGVITMLHHFMQNWSFVITITIISIISYTLGATALEKSRYSKC